MKLERTLAVALLMFTAVSSPQAFAETQTVHATACIQSDDSAGIINRTEYRITNIGSTNATVFCPITLDWGEIIDRGILVDVFVKDSHSSYVSCKLSMRNNDGSARVSETGYSSNSDDRIRLFLDDVNWDAFTAGAVALSCTLPPNSGSNYTKVYRYYIQPGA